MFSVEKCFTARAYGGDSGAGSVFLQSFARTLLDNFDKMSWDDMFLEVKDTVRNCEQVMRQKGEREKELREMEREK